MTDIKDVPAIPSPGMFMEQGAITAPGYSYLSELRSTLSQVREVLASAEGAIEANTQSIADILDMTIEEALGFFSPIPQLKRRLRTMTDVGLGYVKLGQPATTQANIRGSNFPKSFLEMARAALSTSWMSLQQASILPI